MLPAFRGVTPGAESVTFTLIVNPSGVDESNSTRRNHTVLELEPLGLNASAPPILLNTSTPPKSNDSVDTPDTALENVAVNNHVLYGNTSPLAALPASVATVNTGTGGSYDTVMLEWPLFGGHTTPVNASNVTLTVVATNEDANSTRNSQWLWLPDSGVWDTDAVTSDEPYSNCQSDTDSPLTAESNSAVNVIVSSVVDEPTDDDSTGVGGAQVNSNGTPASRIPVNGHTPGAPSAKSTLKRQPDGVVAFNSTRSTHCDSTSPPPIEYTLTEAASPSESVMPLNENESSVTFDTAELKLAVNNHTFSDTEEPLSPTSALNVGTGGSYCTTNSSHP